MRGCIAVLIALAAMAIVPAAQGKLRVDRVGTRCQFTDHPNPPAVCGINAQEVIIGSGQAIFGFKTTKHVRLGLTIAITRALGGSTYVEKRTKDGKYLEPSGPLQGAFLLPSYLCVPHPAPKPGQACTAERWDLSAGSYVVREEYWADPAVRLPFALTVTATPSGYVKP